MAREGMGGTLPFACGTCDRYGVSDPRGVPPILTLLVASPVSAAGLGEGKS